MSVKKLQLDCLKYKLYLAATLLHYNGNGIFNINGF